MFQNLEEEVIEEFDSEYAKNNIIKVYYEMAQIYNKSFKIHENFNTCFNKDYQYDIKLED